MNLISCSFIITLLSLSGIGHAASGILELDSKPGGAEVFVDGKKKGITPETEGQKLTMELPEGDHEIMIKKEGTGSATKKVFVGDGVIQPLTLTILPEAYTNSLGMKFVPVPGTQILMCIHETRNKDYAQFATENRGVDQAWKNVVFSLGTGKKYTTRNDANHPVVNVNWDEANAFCAWLGKKDGHTYRLPTDHEWSCAVGIGDQENARDTVNSKAGKAPGYPWGDGYPPPRNNVGNYYDGKVLRMGETDSTVLENYDDGFLLTAPVMNYPANKLGIYDLGGNVGEFCRDEWRLDLIKKVGFVSRDHGWGSRISSERDLRSSARTYYEPTKRYDVLGFRCVLVSGDSFR